jgi:hypothetical protein
MIMKKITLLFVFVIMTFLLGGCALYSTDGLVPFRIEVYNAPEQIYYTTNPPFYPGYQWQYWYTMSAEPGIIFFIGKDGRHRRHHYR